MSNNKTLKLAAGLAASLLVLAGCTKQRPFKEVPKDEPGSVRQAKADAIDTEAEYIYVPSTLESGRKSTASRPHWMADAKRVKFVFTETALRVIEPEKDGRFADNPTNARSVLTIPIDHVDYRCKEDDFGDCTNHEEENKFLPWDKRAFFKLKPKELKEQQVTFMPVDIMNWITGGFCYKEVGSDFVGAEWTKDSVNIILEKTYQGNIACDQWTGDLSNFTFSVRYQHSFAKLSKLASPDYKVAKYTRADESNFGFFNTEKEELDIDNNDVIKSRSWMFDRWNPNRTVVYHLSENFLKPENKALKQATYRAFEVVNNGLAKIGAKLRLELRDPVPGLSPADVRNNMIVMVEDALAINLLGYGPHASNPLTGEILHARTVMYSGIMKKFVRWTYDEIVEKKLEAKRQAAPLTIAPTLQAAASSVPSMDELGGITASVAPQALLARIPIEDIKDGRIDIKKLSELATSPKVDTIYSKDIKEMIAMLSKHCEYMADFMDFEASIGDGVDEAIEKVGLKPWDQLSEVEKQTVLDVLMPYSWLPTLIHELGHNLGLRHNFAGSEDKDNFYTEKELKDFGASGEWKYSSIMDYGYRTMYELRQLGKYDLAALRYGYKEEVELADGKIVKLDELRANPALEIKPYAYCTDEHADANPNCNRFDEGVNLYEMSQHFVRAYNKRYERANFRNNRYDFSLYNDMGQVMAIDYTMFNLRLAFERYEMIKNLFDLPDNAAEWNDKEKYPWLWEIRQAAVTAGNFYLNVLKTPDLMCAAALAAKPNEIVALVPIRNLSRRAISCFDAQEIRLNPQYVIVAEGGKSFNSRKSVYNENFYVDQIDVRGIWMDKLLAAHYLFARELGSTIFDDYTENFLHMQEMQGPILETVDGLAADDLVAPVTFRTAAGEKIDFNVSFRLFDTKDNDNSHKIEPPLDGNVARMFGLSTTTAWPFHPKAIGTMLEQNLSSAHRPMSDAFNNRFKVRAGLPDNGRPASDYVVTEIGGIRYYALPEATVATQLMASYKTVTLLGQLTEAQLQKVLMSVDDTGLTEIEKQARALGVETLQRYLQGGFQSQQYYAMIILQLAKF